MLNKREKIKILQELKLVYNEREEMYEETKENLISFKNELELLITKLINNSNLSNDDLFDIEININLYNLNYV